MGNYTHIHTNPNQREPAQSMANPNKFMVRITLEIQDRPNEVYQTYIRQSNLEELQKYFLKLQNDKPVPSEILENSESIFRSRAPNRPNPVPTSLANEDVEERKAVNNERNKLGDAVSGGRSGKITFDNSDTDDEGNKPTIKKKPISQGGEKKKNESSGEDEDQPKKKVKPITHSGGKRIDKDEDDDNGDNLTVKKKKGIPQSGEKRVSDENRESDEDTRKAKKSSQVASKTGQKMMDEPRGVTNPRREVENEEEYKTEKARPSQSSKSAKDSKIGEQILEAGLVFGDYSEEEDDGAREDFTDRGKKVDLDDDLEVIDIKVSEWQRAMLVAKMGPEIKKIVGKNDVEIDLNVPGKVLVGGENATVSKEVKGKIEALIKSLKSVKMGERSGFEAQVLRRTKDCEDENVVVVKTSEGTFLVSNDEKLSVKDLEDIKRDVEAKKVDGSVVLGKQSGSPLRNGWFKQHATGVIEYLKKNKMPELKNIEKESKATVVVVPGQAASHVAAVGGKNVDFGILKRRIAELGREVVTVICRGPKLNRSDEGEAEDLVEDLREKLKQGKCVLMDRGGERLVLSTAHGELVNVLEAIEEEDKKKILLGREFVILFSFRLDEATRQKLLKVLQKNQGRRDEFPGQWRPCEESATKYYYH
eukprot:TRINITY_DN9360_c0_g1_i2.p1 TRINITY_DN9360_c0_g1~~TRINITY_DN9360_c0_g1_i2.p1  ORF type:complete len:647 (+),score=165.36 TRINITY_DN9360_c0_g1_i2:3-1943(+)